MKPANEESPASPSGRNSEASSAGPTRGFPNSERTCGSAADCAAKASFFAQSPSACADDAISKAARAYGRARVSGCDMSSHLGDELIEQRLVRVRVDLALEDLLGARHGERGDLAAQFLARTMRHALDIGRGRRLLARRFDDRILLGLLDDLSRLLMRLVDDRHRFAARLLDFVGDACVGIGQFLDRKSVV